MSLRERWMSERESLWERVREREERGREEREKKRERERERERERREEKRREETDGEERRRKSKRGIFRVRSTSLRATFFTIKNLNVLLQPFCSRWIRKDDEKIPNGFGRNRYARSIPTLRKSIVYIDARAVDALCSCTPGKIESVRTNGAAISPYSLLKIELSSLPHITSYKVFHLPNETKIQKSRQGMLAHFFFDAAEPVGNKHAALSVDHGWRKAHTRRRHKTNTVHFLFRVFF